MNSMHHTYGCSKTLIVQRLTTLQRQFQEASQALQEFGNPLLPQYLSEMNHPLNFTTMSPMVTAVVGKDSTDHRLVQYVYDLKPNKQQIRSIRNIWKAIYNKQAC
ncbi:unnamed protein product [Rotaria sp. Silwood1]|nr:unnamed protein product [Rotaria sp. Silwood1]CAF1645571.1 unnamed protein product [Rotaria sp. Silwood1]CAF3862822.1 unnamed protein product [Rotaria sp. Silwood1]